MAKKVDNPTSKKVLILFTAGQKVIGTQGAWHTISMLCLILIHFLKNSKINVTMKFSR